MQPNENTDTSPSYYADLPIEPWYVTRLWNLTFNLGCALKYIVRCGKKPGEPAVKDLQKAITYLQFEIMFLEEQQAAKEAEAEEAALAAEPPPDNNIFRSLFSGSSKKD